jgi:uncharacterized protein
VPDISIIDDETAHRYVLFVDGHPAGLIEYRARPGLIALNHTEVEPAYEGQGLAGRLVRFALDDARARGRGVLPFCPYVRSYLQRHPEDVELVPESTRGEFDL